jgi:hypothetical protein
MTSMSRTNRAPQMQPREIGVEAEDPIALDGDGIPF